MTFGQSEALASRSIAASQAAHRAVSIGGGFFSQQS